MKKTDRVPETMKQEMSFEDWVFALIGYGVNQYRHGHNVIRYLTRFHGYYKVKENLESLQSMFNRGVSFKEAHLVIGRKVYEFEQARSKDNFDVV